ncbi:MAG: methyl-accepting chemotaxis protein [Aquificota bacterium]|nr:methyl-accepting chemotaxis protein [Aquificota bacterium]
MSIRARLGLVNALLVVVAVIIGAVIYNAEKRVESSIERVNEELYYLDLYREMKIDLLSTAIEVRNLILDPTSEEARKGIRENLKAFMDKLRILRERAEEFDEKEAEWTRDLAFFTYGGDIEGVIQLVEMEALEEARDQLVEVERAGFKDTLDLLNTLISYRVEKIKKEQESVRAYIRKANIVMLGVTIPSILVVSAVLYFISRGIIRQIAEISSEVDNLAKGMRFKDISLRKFRNELDRLISSLEQMVRDIGSAVVSIKGIMLRVSKGNLKVRVEGNYRGDIGELMSYVNKSLRDLQETLGSVKEGLVTIAESIRSLNASTQQIERENENLNSSIASIMTSVDETSEAIRQISEETQRARNVSLDMERAIQTGKSKVTFMHTSMGNIVEVSREVNSITETIIDIAEQINLLALNAAIEAARAGELGRGFAVVADEVRRLAEISGNAAKEISALIDKAVKTVEEGRVASEELVDSYVRIEEVTKEIARVIDTIATAMEEQSRAIDIIRDNMTEITSISERNTESMKRIAQEVRNISQVAEQVEDRMKSFDV